MRNIVHAPALPPTNKTFQMKEKPSTLNDAVKSAIMNGAYERMHPYLQSVDKKVGVMGSLRMDQAAAAMELQKWGADTGVEAIQKADWEQLHRAINTALRYIKDENGRPIDRNSRRLAALAAPAKGE